MPATTLPLPPVEMRQYVGLADEEFYDNPAGAPVYPDLPPSAYESVLDFGCGCGRLARKMLLQVPRPTRYLGLDVHRDLIAWCQKHLAPVDRGFRFVHHDVYSPSYGHGNTLRLAEPIPAPDADVSLAIAHSVFTHLTLDQTEYYLGELARVLRADGVAFTSWFFFDRVSFPFFPVGPFALYADEKDVTRAVLYDRGWFLDALRRVGLAVKRTERPHVPGHQWSVWLGRRQPGEVDQFPTGTDGADWVSGATWRSVAEVAVSEDLRSIARSGSRTSEVHSETFTRAARPPVPGLFGALAELAEWQNWDRKPLWRKFLGAIRRRGRRLWS